MRRKKITLLVSILCWLIGGNMAFSSPIFQLGIDNGIFFKNVENWVDNDPSGTPGFGVVSPGDLFYGIIGVQNIDVPPTFGATIWSSDDTPPGIDSFSGYFLTAVTGIIPPGAGPLPGSDPFIGAPDVHIVLGPAGADPNGVMTPADLLSGVVLKLFTDTTTAYESNGTVADDILKATNGPLWGSFTTTGGYWYSHAPALPPGFGSIGESFGGLNFVTNATGLQWDKVNDPLEAESCLGCVPPGLPVDIYFTSEIEDFGANPSGWRFGSNDPAVMHPVPEPGSLFLLGTGLLGLAGVRIRKRKANVA